MQPRVGIVIAALAGMLLGCASLRSASPLDASPECSEVEAFATQLTDIATDFDYEPSSGPRELAERVDAVIWGYLTGDSTAQGEYLGYELGEVSVLAGEVPEPGSTVTVSVGFNPSYRTARSHQDAIVRGAPIIAFAERTDRVPGGLIAHLPEGFMTACDGQPPIGWAVDYDEWGEMGSLEGVARAVDEAEH